MWSRRRLIRRLRRRAVPIVVVATTCLAALWFVQSAPSETLSAPPLAIDDDSLDDSTRPQVTISTIDPVSTSERYALVEFEARAIDNEDGELRATCVPASGSMFRVGTTDVTCVATDSAANVGVARASVQVVNAAGSSTAAASNPDQVLGRTEVASTSSNSTLAIVIASLLAVAAITLGLHRRSNTHRRHHRHRA